MGKGIINVKSNFVYQAIYSVQNKQHGLKFPTERVEKYLLTEGYKKNIIESNNYYIVMIKDENKVFIGKKIICFEVLPEDVKEKYHQKLTSFVILRYKIFSDATIQNIESAKNNLIQNKLRTCVSNMYYSLHNGMSAMVEYYKSTNESTNLGESDNEGLDDEAFLGHFTPAAFKVFLENIDDICINDKCEYLESEKMKSGRMKSENNPFSWIYPLFYDKICNIESDDNDIKILLEDMATSLIDVSLDNIAVDDTQKRSNFEKELKKSLEIVKSIIKEEEKYSIKYILAVLSGYFSYAYMLRQLGDYDSLFEVKVNQKEVIRWTITSAQFIDMILNYLDIGDNESQSKIQIINARSSRETLNDLYYSTDMDLMTITGIVIDRDFNLIKYATNLLKKKGYSLFNQDDEIPSYDKNDNKIIICKNIVMTPYRCFITISNTGIFRIDVVLLDGESTKMKKTINTSYLERFIHKEILEEDFQQLLSSKGRIVIGAPIIYQDEDYSKLELLFKTHELIQLRYNIKISRMIDRISDEMYDNKILIVPIVNIFRDNDIIRYTSNWKMKLKRMMSSKEGFDNSIKIVFTIIANDKISFNENDEDRIVEKIRKFEEIENEIKIKYINISDEDLKQVIYGDEIYIRNIFKNIINSYKVNDIVELSETLNGKYLNELEDIAIDVEEDE
ncbi:hypothetical protein WS9_007050 [Paraclostridium sordellii 8483]|uniref:hypothetical protein n=1 Tax=Paraclostridium sordellii TaxID=1505 RepID=UPI000316CA22|nr:hypothetical protein [Paeniclostridium sordellii]TAN67947.1 hypothetical protein WS9_007050 [Paeniclostridium sordellii 8483]